MSVLMAAAPTPSAGLTLLYPILGILAGVALGVGWWWRRRVGARSIAEQARRAVSAQAGTAAERRDTIRSFLVPQLDLSALLSSASGGRALPTELPHGTILVNQRLGIKCLLLEPIAEVSAEKLKAIGGRRLKPNEVIYLPMGTQVLRDEILHQGLNLALKLRKGTLFLSPGGHPNGYLLDELILPLRRELRSNPQFLGITEKIAERYLQSLVDIPLSFTLLKEDLLYDTSEQNQRTVEKGTLVISRSGLVIGLLLDDVELPIKGPVSDLAALFLLKGGYHRVPIPTLIQQAGLPGVQELAIERGTFIFSPQGKIYFVWKDGVKVSKQKLVGWSKASNIEHPSILQVSLERRNIIGGPGEVITQDEINYLREVFAQAGTSNILKDTLLLDNNVFYKFTADMPYAQSGKFRGYLGKGVVILNSYRKGTFSVELGGKSIEVSDRDLENIRKHLQAEGRILIKISTLLRITDEKYGDWVYRVTTNLFYPYPTLTRPYLEEFIPENIAFDHRAPKLSTLIGPQEHPREEDIGAAGEPLADLPALVNNELAKQRLVFVLDGTLFHWKGRLYRVNEELSWRPQITEKINSQDLEALESEWKIHPLVEERREEEVPRELAEEEDLEDLPFDTDPLR